MHPPQAFDFFWSCLQEHPHCILRMESNLMAVNDDHSFHWVFGNTEEGYPLMQVLQGKHTVGEMVLMVDAESPVSLIQEGEDFVYQIQGQSFGEWELTYRITTTHSIEESSDTSDSVH